MEKTKVFILFDLVLYLIQIFLMVTLSKYLQNNTLYFYFAFSLVYNLIISFFLFGIKLYNIKIIILNIFFAISVYCFGNRNLFRNRDFWNIITGISFNASILFLLGGNWIFAFILNKLFQRIFGNYKNEIPTSIPKE